ncbi:MAG: adenylate/guanylate cyclase domain-containing protein [Candidatus Limnocylindria bacterium]
MAQLDGKHRAQLPDSAFAYIDSRRRRRLPIHDQAHVRNALARFSRVAFEDEAAREQARTRLLKAARKYGIVPVGFISGQLRSLTLENERLHHEVTARSTDVRSLPIGVVTFLFTDIEDSTGLLGRLGDGYAGVLERLRAIQHAAVERSGGRTVDTRADEYFAVFERATAAVEAALAIDRAIGDSTWPGRREIRLRIGIHSGEPTLTDTGYVGLAVHAAARVCSAAHGGQILLSAAARDASGDALPPQVVLRSLGPHRLRGLSEAEELFQVERPDLQAAFPSPRRLGATPSD